MQIMTPIPHQIKRFTPLVWVLLIAFSIRLLLPLIAFILTKELAIFYGGDTASYLMPANELLRSGSFTTNGFPEIFRAPGYSLLLIPGLLFNQVEFITIGWQIILSCLTVYLVYKIALLIFEHPKIALISAVLYALEPLSIVYPGKVLTETAFGFFIFAFLYVFLKYLNNQSLTILLLAAILLSISAYIRPVAYYLPILFTLILVIFIFIKIKNNRKIILIHAFVFFLISMGSLYAWNLRNKAVIGYSGFSSVTEVNLYYWHAGAVLTAKEGTSFAGQKAQLLAQLNQDVPKEALQGEDVGHICICAPNYASSAVLKYMRESAKKIISAHPWIYLKLRLNGMLNLMLNSTPWPYLTLFNRYQIGGFADIADRYNTEFYSKGWLAGMAFYLNQVPLDVSISWLILQVNLIVYMLLAGVGIISKNFFKQPASLILMTLGFYFLAIAGGPEGSSARYRHPIMPIICILAGYGVYFLGKKLKRKTD